jgi:hypothetical protein
MLFRCLFRGLYPVTGKLLELSQLTTEVLVLCGTAYLCEKIFLAMAAIKLKHGNSLKFESCHAMDVTSDFTIPAFGHHDTICVLYFSVVP